MTHHTMAAFLFSFPGRLGVTLTGLLLAWRAFLSHAVGIQLLLVALASVWVAILLRHYQVI